MPGCVLRAAGQNFDVDEFLASSLVGRVLTQYC